MYIIIIIVNTLIIKSSNLKFETISVDSVSHTYEVETTRCQALREMWSKQKTCEESQADVLVVQDSCFIVCTVLADTQENLGTNNVQ